MDNSFGMSNESLEATENYMRGDKKADPFGKGVGGADKHEISYDRETDMRGDMGVAINPILHDDHNTLTDTNKVPSPRLYQKALRKKAAEEVSNIPLQYAMDAISDASQNVSILMQRKLSSPPAPIISATKQKPASTPDDTTSYGFYEPLKNIKVFEIWKVFLNIEDGQELDCVYVVLSANYLEEQYGEGKWSNVRYRGFYDTLGEAKNQISGHLR